MWGDPNARPQEQGDRVTCEELQNHVIILRPVEYIESMRVKDETKDAIKVNIVDLTDDSRMYRGVLFFNRLIGTFKRDLGTPYFGYIGKERTPSGYMGWAFISLAGNADWEPVAQAWSEANPEFFTEALPEKRERRDHFADPMPTDHHEQGPAPEWAGAVPPRPPAPPVAPPAAPAGPPAPRSAPPAPPAARPVSAAPASVPGGGASMLERLKRQAEQPTPFGSTNRTSGEIQEPPY